MEHQIILEWEVPLPPGLDLASRLAQVIDAALHSEGLCLPCEVNVLLTDNPGIQAINLEMRGVDAVTDVLSFPMFELTPGIPPAGGDYVDPGSGLCPLGDMVLCLERAALQAAEFGHSLEREVCYLTVHSVLHLLGYDHLDEGAQQAAMRGREEAILAQLGLTR